MMTIFMVFFGIGSVVFGKLSDIFSLRGLIATGVGIYVAASLLGFAFRSSYLAVVAARALQGSADPPSPPSYSSRSRATSRSRNAAGYSAS